MVFSHGCANYLVVTLFLVCFLLCPLFVNSNDHNHPTEDRPHHPITDSSNPLHNVSSPEFLAVAKKTIATISENCMFTHFYSDSGHKKAPDYIFPTDAEAHFLELKTRTEPFRHNTVHTYTGYSGPWIENLFIQHYFHKPLHHFRGIFPLFLQWIDSEIVKEMKAMIQCLKGIIRPDVLYLAISQGDAGLHEAVAHFPNILVMSAGGFGHIVLPLIKGEIPYEMPPPTYARDFAFYGIDRKERHNLLMAVADQAQIHNLSLTIGYGENWKRDMTLTRFNLAPRGYGRSSFRFAESVQMGRLPIYLYDDYLWLPYIGTNKSVETFGFAARLQEVPEVVRRIKEMTAEEFQRRLAKLKEVRSAYTYPGALKEIDKFLHDPLGPHGGDLRCVQHPRSFFCCG